MKVQRKKKKRGMQLVFHPPYNAPPDAQTFRDDRFGQHGPLPDASGCQQRKKKTGQLPTADVALSRWSLFLKRAAASVKSC